VTGTPGWRCRHDEQRGAKSAAAAHHYNQPDFLKRQCISPHTVPMMLKASG
jgi:hypothetical protein